MSVIINIIGDNMKRATIWLLLIIMLPIKIYAKECTDGELASLKKLAANITYSYEYYFKDNEIYYDITIANLYEDIYVVDLATKDKYKAVENIIRGKKSGQALKFEVYSKTCNELLTTKIVQLPKYNKYYGSEHCKDVPEFKYCSKWGNYDLTEKEFIEKVEEYKRKIGNLVIDEEPIIYETEIPGFYVFISLILLILIMLLISIHRKKREKDII